MVREFNETNSRGSSASQQKIPMISTSYNWEGVFLRYLRMKFYSFVLGLESNMYNIFIEQKSLLDYTMKEHLKADSLRFIRETDSFSIDYLR